MQLEHLLGMDEELVIVIEHNHVIGKDEDILNC